MHDGDISPCHFLKGANGAAVLFMKMSLVVSWFTKFELKRILIAAIRAQETSEWFSVIHLIIFYDKIVAEQKQV